MIEFIIIVDPGKINMEDVLYLREKSRFLSGIPIIRYKRSRWGHVDNVGFAIIHLPTMKSFSTDEPHMITKEEFELLKEATT